MSATQFRPKYVSFDCYGTLISWPMTPITKELVGDQIPAEQWDQFVAEFRGYRYDQVCGEYYPYEQVLPEAFVHVSSPTRYDPLPMHDMGFRNLVLLDRGYDPVPPGYDLVTVKSLDELNTMLGI